MRTLSLQGALIFCLVVFDLCEIIRVLCKTGTISKTCISGTSVRVPLQVNLPNRGLGLVGSANEHPGPALYQNNERRGI